MATKEKSALINLFDLLEARFAIQLIWALRDGHGQTFRLLQDSIGDITPNTLNTRLKEFRASGFVVHNGDGYKLTSQGASLANKLLHLTDVAAKLKKAQAPIKKTEKAVVKKAIKSASKTTTKSTANRKK